MTLVGLPHSEISASEVVCTYTELIAAYHVLLRLSVPRHPPCALSSLIENLQLQKIRAFHFCAKLRSLLEDTRDVLLYRRL
jgi:hypothetical protein